MTVPHLFSRNAQMQTTGCEAPSSSSKTFEDAGSCHQARKDNSQEAKNRPTLQPRTTATTADLETAETDSTTSGQERSISQLTVAQVHPEMKKTEATATDHKWKSVPPLSVAQVHPEMGKTEATVTMQIGK